MKEDLFTCGLRAFAECARTTSCAINLIKLMCMWLCKGLGNYRGNGQSELRVQVHVSATNLRRSAPGCVHVDALAYT